MKFLITIYRLFNTLTAQALMTRPLPGAIFFHFIVYKLTKKYYFLYYHYNFKSFYAKNALELSRCLNNKKIYLNFP